MIPEIEIHNIFKEIPSKLDDEFFETIIKKSGFKLERIVSEGHVTPEGEWYDQQENEWVLLLSGRAKLLLESDPEPVTLTPGDHLLIPAHVKHRVEWTAPDTRTVWLAIHF